MVSHAEYTALMQELAAYRQSDQLLLLKGMARGESLTDAKFRHVRAAALQTLATKLHRASRVCDFRNEIVVRPEGVFVNISGVLMEVSLTSFYLKSSVLEQANQAEQIDHVLRRLNITLSTAVDVGANFGEISLWFAREYPAARIIAIEPSSYNMKVLKRNKEAQSFATDRLELIQEAVGDKRGVVNITSDMSSMNRIVCDENQSAATERVSCDRLDGIFERCRVETADFVKIDIEGSEPKLREAVVALRDRVRSYYIEFSQFASNEDYMALARSLLSQRYVCYDETASITLRNAPEVAQHLRQAFAPGPMAVTNLWFVRA
jgi:FkbM family methyltransferase